MEDSGVQIAHSNWHQMENGMKYLPSWLRMVSRVAVITAAAIGVMWSPGMTQDVAVGTVQATVLASLAVTAAASLDFGTVYQGVAKSVADNTADAGVFTISGQASSQITVYMQLPEYLQGPGNDRMVISFSTTGAVFDPSGNVDPTTPGLGHSDENPHAFSNGLTLSAGGAAAIFLGGRVIPSVNQAAGAYSGDIVVTVAYNGS
ncbi:hypothetical protein C3F09_01115 [candidate division GN15 bacterium]|uniref:DUF4402 domain-containing protein n=1 Tax=candidate division GN15 bacterium TaxID=2072418 RepID=A0A855XBR0_9BACT|nr:MAG: hypothetical protein C3F09_01115 [candidate division GN15 bacterium]